MFLIVGGGGGVIFLFFETFLLFNRTFALGFFSEYKCSFSEWNLDREMVDFAILDFHIPW